MIGPATTTVNLLFMKRYRFHYLLKHDEREIMRLKWRLGWWQECCNQVRWKSLDEYLIYRYIYLCNKEMSHKQRRQSLKRPSWNFENTTKIYFRVPSPFFWVAPVCQQSISVAKYGSISRAEYDQNLDPMLNIVSDPSVRHGCQMTETPNLTYLNDEALINPVQLTYFDKPWPFYCQNKIQRKDKA